MNNPSPLRYPGGKFKIVPLVKKIIEKAHITNCVYVEPFAGGAGIALTLLLSGFVDEIVINDYDCAIASFWRAILTEPNRFVDMIASVPLNIEEWHRQREIYFNSTRYSFEYGFATFYLNRTNHSGILSSGPIGGRLQNDPNWTLDVRFNRQGLIQRIHDISEKKRRIHCYNKDVLSFIISYLPRYGQNSFVYFDPPYYNKGKKLYKNFLEPRDHRNIAKHIFENVQSQWIVSYDDVPEIEQIYANYPSRKFSLSYSLANNGQGTEVMFFREETLCPTHEELENDKINIIMWE